MAKQPLWNGELFNVKIWADSPFPGSNQVVGFFIFKALTAKFYLGQVETDVHLAGADCCKTATASRIKFSCSVQVLMLLELQQENRIRPS